MKSRFLLIIAVSVFSILFSCTKEDVQPQLTFTNNVSEGTADANGEFNLTGRIVSEVALDKVIITKQGESSPFLVDESTAKNKNEFDFSYLITGITANTTIIIDVYDQEGGKITSTFLIRK